METNTELEHLGSLFFGKRLEIIAFSGALCRSYVAFIASRMTVASWLSFYEACWTEVLPPLKGKGGLGEFGI